MWETAIILKSIERQKKTTLHIRVKWLLKKENQWFIDSNQRSRNVA